MQDSQECLLREYALGMIDPLSKRICRSIKQDGTYIYRVSKDTWSVHHWTLNDSRCLESVARILRVRVMLEIP
jgi:hypothetical protein